MDECVGTCVTQQEEQCMLKVVLQVGFIRP